MNGDRVRQAREISKLNQNELAKDLQKGQSTIARIENHTLEPSEELLKAVALQTGFPLSFFKQGPPIEFPLGTLLFRARATAPARDKSYVYQYGRILFEAAHRLQEQFDAITTRLPSFKGDPTMAAQLTRSSMGLSPDTPIGHLLHAVERLGVLVLPVSSTIQGLDAYCTWAGRDSLRPVIVISNTEAGDRLRFSVAHELGHLTMHEAMIGDLKSLEQEANRFASELLMPRQGILNEFETPITLDGIARLKPRWRVSIQALVLRAKSLRLISASQYKHVMQQVAIRGWRTHEPDNLKIPNERPRGFRQMAEAVYGNPIDLKRMASDLSLPIRFIKETLESCAEAPRKPKTSPVSISTNIGKVVRIAAPYKRDTTTTTKT